jgi:hypothetical protein
MQGVEKLNETPHFPTKLTPSMASLRLLVLRFVRSYLSHWGASPSYGEIAAGLDTNRTRVKKAVRSLTADGMLLRRPGPRGLAIPDDVTDAVRLLKAHGYKVEPVTNGPLQDDPLLDYDPCGSRGAQRGEEENVERDRGQGGRRAQPATQQLGAPPPSAGRRGTPAAP